MPTGALSAEELERSLITHSTQKASESLTRNDDTQSLNNLAKVLVLHQKMPPSSLPGPPRPNERSVPPPQMQHPRGPFPIPPGKLIFIKMHVYRRINIEIVI